MSENEAMGGVVGFLANIIFWLVVSGIVSGWFWLFGCLLILVNIFMIVILANAPESRGVLEFESPRLIMFLMWGFNPVIAIAIQFKRLLIG
jgi:hypothetical protein